MKHFVDYLNAGKPIIALRTSTHAFKYDHNKASPYAKYDWHSTDWPGGFGQQVLGETWVDHHGSHGKESTRGVINEAFKDHPVLRGVADIWVPTDVYAVTHLPQDAKVLVWGQVLSGMKPTDPPVEGAKNHPMMPVVWLRDYTGESGKTSKVFTTTMGAAVDLENEGLRRLLVNAAYWAVGLEKKIPAKANVDYVGEYKPGWFGFGKFKPGLKPADLALPRDMSLAGHRQYPVEWFSERTKGPWECPSIGGSDAKRNQNVRLGNHRRRPGGNCRGRHGEGLSQDCSGGGQPP